MTRDTSAQDVAAWMLDELRRDGMLFQTVVVYEMTKRFGESFAYHNSNGHLAISKAVLDAFRKLSENNVVWCRSGRYWRLREISDLPGRQQPF